MVAIRTRRMTLSMVTILMNGVAAVAFGQISNSGRGSDVDDVFIYRSVRVMQMPVDGQCSDAGFEVRGQGRYEFTVLSVQGSTGELGNEPMNKVGESLMCFGALTDSAPFPFYARYSLNGGSPTNNDSGRHVV